MIKVTKFIVITFLKSIKQYYRDYIFYRKFNKTVPRGGFCNNIDNIYIGDVFSMGSNCKLYAQDKGAKITIGDHVALNDNVMINADNAGNITIGNYVMIGPNTVFRATNHRFNDMSTAFINQGHEPGVIRVGNNVWFGANVVVLPNVSIGDNTVIGAGSVVSKDIPNNSLALGVPAKVIRNL